ncbi:carboxypeptidase [Tuber indicum]|nr:carboxypeptidase [Tuber indicum]
MAPLKRLTTLILVFGLSFPFALAAQGYPPPVRDQKVIRSPHNPNVYIRYKNPTSEVCRTVSAKQKQFAGYIHLPPLTLAPVQQNYPINTFFWFVEAQEKPESAPLTIWLNGGPGSSSLIGMFSELGPCEAVPVNRNSITTRARPFSWDKASNMLFIDQPNQVGLSFDVPTNGTLALIDPNGGYRPNTTAPTNTRYYGDLGYTDEEFANLEDYSDVIWQIALLNGTFPSGNKEFTANTTEISAMSAWHFLQAWLVNFPQYNPNSTGINLFAESYGGKYGPKFSAYFEEQNERRETGQLSKNDTVELHLESLGIVNGCVDSAIQTPWYPQYANANPYGIRVINDSVRDAALNNYSKPDGCLSRIQRCRALLKLSDPENFGDSDAVNRACDNANKYCSIIRDVYRNSGRGYYDIVAERRDPFPYYYYLEYLNNATVQEAIGTPVNYTQSNSNVYRAFDSTGDFVRGGEVEDIAYLLGRGVKVSLIYGDRDYICNYMGGEAVSLAVDYPNKAAFRAAGYEDIRVNSSYIGGQVRQHGNFSFVRVYQAGHLVPSYQPETAYVIFDRIIRGLSIATGNKITRSGSNIYSTTGPPSTNTTLRAPGRPSPVCFVRDTTTCSLDQILMIAGGKGVIYNGVLYNSPSEYSIPPGLGSSGNGAGTQKEKENTISGDGDTEGGGSAVALGARKASLLALALALATCVGDL